MFSLLYYLHILAQANANVKHFFSFLLLRKGRGKLILPKKAKTLARLAL